MCGVLGYVGESSAQPILMKCLEEIAYRGYDSCGLAIFDDGRLQVFKSAGTVHDLARRNGHGKLSATVGIAHTRWATHGEPNDQNAHPHIDCHGKIAVVHNGIVENYEDIRDELIDAGHKFVSDTDTEVIPHLIEQYMTETDFESAVRKAAGRLTGAFAAVISCADDPTRLLGIRMDCPLIVGMGSGNLFLSSDISALLDYCDRYCVVENGQMASIGSDGLRITTFANSEVVAPQFEEIEWTRERAHKGGHDHFLIKEVHEQPQAIRDTLMGRISGDGTIHLPELDAVLPDQIDRIELVACGSASFACIFAKLVIQELTGITTTMDSGSEYRYQRHSAVPGSLFITVSQSGETADTIACLRIAKDAGAVTFSIVNVVGTTIARESDSVAYTHAGPELAVPATKSLLAQMAMLELIGIHLRGGDESALLARQLATLPYQVQRALDIDMREVAKRFSKRDNWFVVGRGLDEPIAREGALKLKEMAYIHAEPIPGGELKHGPIALIEEGMPVIALATQPAVRIKMLSNVQEILARRGAVLVITTEDDLTFDRLKVDVVKIPSVSPLVDPITAIVPLQLLAYHCGLERGTEIDYPRNLAKSVTVE